MSDNEEQSGPAETTQGTSHSVGELNAKAGEQLKKQRRQLRGKITRSINRVKKFIEQGAEMRKRVEKEGLQIRKDFELARECHSKMYEYVDESLIPAMDDWEDVLTNDLYDIEEKIESFLQSLSEPGLAKSVSVSKEQNSERSGIINNINVDAGGSDVELNNVAPGTSSVVENQSQPKEDSEACELVVNEDSVILESSEPKNTCNSSNPKSNCHNLSSPQAFDT